MKIQVISDLHFDVEPVRSDLSLHPEADALVVAGDVCEGIEESFVWLRQRFGTEIPIVAVAGNHSFYRRAVREELQKASRLAVQYNINFLENAFCEIGGVLFLGCTLWTDYCLAGEPFRLHAMVEAKEKMHDHKKIALQKQPWKRFLPQDAASWHHKSKQFILETTASRPRSKKVVVTHHAPSMKSVAPIFRETLLTSAYASNLDNLVAQSNAQYWIHGHLHNSSEYEIADTKVVCNPHGYGSENPHFASDKCIEI